MDDKTFRETFLRDVTEFVKNAEANDLVEMYNTFSENEVEMNENSFIIKTPETKEIIADAEKADAPEEDDEEGEAEKSSKDKHQGRVDVHSHLNDEEDMGEDVELEQPAEDKFTNDLDPQPKD